MCIHMLNYSCCFFSWLFHPTASTELQGAWPCRLLPCLHYTVQHFASWGPICKSHLAYFDVRILYVSYHSCHWWYAFSVWCPHTGKWIQPWLPSTPDQWMQKHFSFPKVESFLYSLYHKFYIVITFWSCTCHAL